MTYEEMAEDVSIGVSEPRGLVDRDERPIVPLQDVPIPPEYPDGVECSILLPCVICNRTFFPRALERHQRVCQKLQHRDKRGVFEITKKRVEGLDVPLLGIEPPTKKVAKKKSKWREKRNEFLMLVRAAKTPKGGDSSDEYYDESKRFIPSDYQKCPHCDRYFGPKAVDRHVSWCREQKSRKTRSITSEEASAIQRQKARTKYTPPKPGKSEWKAPKKKDVVSSIPPQQNGSEPPPLHHSAGLRTPPIYRRTSSPSPYRPPSQRHMSPSPGPGVGAPLSRKGSCTSLPPGPPRSYGGSLGRSAGKKFSSMLQSFTGCQPGYGVSSGYGSSHMYGSPAGYAPVEFHRSNSFRSAKKRPTGRMARHRDLASDMLASVSMFGDKIKREDPEGDEASNVDSYEEDFTMRKENYDPFSEAEMQMQNLMHNPEALKSMKMKDFDRSNSFIEDADTTKRLRPVGSRSLCSLGFDPFDFNSLNLNSPDTDSSGMDSVEHSPIEGRSIITGTEEILASFSPNKTVESYLQNSLNEFDANFSLLQRNNRYNSSRLPTLDKKRLSDIRKIPDGGFSWRRDTSPSPSIQSTNWNTSPGKSRYADPYSGRHSRGSSLPRLSPPSPSMPRKPIKGGVSHKVSVPSFCSDCGCKYTSFAKFCSYCGAKRVCNY